LKDSKVTICHNSGIVAKRAKKSTGAAIFVCEMSYNVSMSQIRVGVVRGGPSSEYAVSLKTGESILRHLDRQKYVPVDILLTTRGEWYMNGVRTDLGTIAQHIDVAWNALHGTFGEDGKVQQLFESFGIPYTGSGVMASAIGMHKGLAKERFREMGLLTPQGIIIDALDNFDEVAAQVYHNHPMSLVVKPVSGGSSVATNIVRTYEELIRALGAASKYGDILVEELIEGKEATCCVIDTSVAGQHVVLFPIEIVPPASTSFFDYDAKYGGGTEEICPGRFTFDTHQKLRELASKAHRAIGARHYSRSDFIISPKGIYILETNTLPGLTEESLLPKALTAGGVQIPEFLDHILSLTLSK
jgi:D-alanine-D-alanine ligase